MQMVVIVHPYSCSEPLYLCCRPVQVPFKSYLLSYQVIVDFRAVVSRRFQETIAWDTIRMAFGFVHALLLVTSFVLPTVLFIFASSSVWQINKPSGTPQHTFSALY